MLNFIDAVKNILAEKNKTVKELFENKIISENTFYKYKQRYPSLKTLIKIANYLEVSIDYLFEIDINNQFFPYVFGDLNFYNNLLVLIKNKRISGRKFCNDLNYSRDNLLRWKAGTAPSMQTLIEISEYFGCTIDDLLLK